MKLTSNYQTGFNGYPKQPPALLTRPERYTDLTITPTHRACIARGLGGSYGDAALNQKQHVVLTERLDRLLFFDPQRGMICAEAGISLQKLLNFTVPQGWFLPVTPGTKQVTLGGCVAADIHGKNHPQEGSIGQHLLELELITAQGKRIICSKGQEASLFWASVGGMGLTGIIGTITLQLKAIQTSYLVLQQKSATDLSHTLAYLAQANQHPYEYAVAWLDCLNPPWHHSIIQYARHATLDDNLSCQQRLNPLANAVQKPYLIPMALPTSLLHPSLIKSFNRYYFKSMLRKADHYIAHYSAYCYPLDQLAHWPRLYGPSGFIQYQCALPNPNADRVIKKLLASLREKNCPVYLATLKYFGDESPAWLSFPLPGFSLALDLPMRPDLLSCLDDVDSLVAAAGGRVYLAKDARLKPEMFRAMYPRHPTWLAIKHHWDPEQQFSSSLSRRLKLTA